MLNWKEKVRRTVEPTVAEWVGLSELQEKGRCVSSKTYLGTSYSKNRLITETGGSLASITLT
jgi:hypothetical protein